MAASNATKKPSYQRLKQETWSDEEEDLYHDIREKVVGNLRGRAGAGAGGSSRSGRRSFYVRRKLRVRIPSLRRFLGRKARLIKLACCKVYKRLMQSRAHFAELFAGNYLLMQVNPVTSLKFPASSYYAAANVHKPAGGAPRQLYVHGLSASSHRINV